MKDSYNCLMLGSLPLSLNEITLAPAIISAKIKNKGHNFSFLDINLELYEFCNQDINLYHEKIEYLCAESKVYTDDPLINRWEQFILDKIAQCNFLLVNVFSNRSHPVAVRLITETRSRFPEIKILVGGIGSHKILNYIRTFDGTDQRLGKLLLDNNLIDYWQEDVSLTTIDEAIPTNAVAKESFDFDFSVFNLDRYLWETEKTLPLVGSFGCVRQCSFCDVINHFPKYSFIEADSLTKQIVSIYNETGTSKFNFMDSLVNGSLKNFENLLKNLAHSRIQKWLPDDFEWNGTYICRPPSIQLDRIHELLPLSGANNLIIGVESGSDKIRFEMDKKFTNDDLLY